MIEREYIISSSGCLKRLKPVLGSGGIILNEIKQLKIESNPKRIQPKTTGKRNWDISAKYFAV